MSVITAKVEITGLKEFNKGLRAMDTGLPKATRLALNDAVAIVIGFARSRIPRRTGRAAASLTARSTRTSARVAAGGRKAPYYPWLDFGGKTPGHHASRPYYREGRYLYPALRIKRDEFTAAMERGILAVAQDAGIEVS